MVNINEKYCTFCGQPLPEPFYYVDDLRFCSKHCASFAGVVISFPTPPTPSQVKDELSKTMVELTVKLAAGNVAAKEREKALKQLESLRASVRILEKQKLVLTHENSRLYAKVRDLDNLCAEQIEYIEELERKVIQEDDNPSYIAELHAILDKQDKEIKELEEFKVGYQEVLTNQQRLYLENRELQQELYRLREEARQCPQTHKF